jgi:nucleoside-diphosphate-sugar epimerase
VLLQRGYRVTVVDDLLFGGESLLGHWHHPRFRFVKGDVLDPAVLSVERGGLRVGHLKPETYHHVIHLAAIVGFHGATTWRR